VPGNPAMMTIMVQLARRESMMIHARADLTGAEFLE